MNERCDFGIKKVRDTFLSVKIYYALFQSTIQTTLIKYT